MRQPYRLKNKRYGRFAESTLQMQYPFLDLSRPEFPWNQQLRSAADRVIESGRYLHGPETEGLENELSALCNTERCVAVSNGLDALRLIFRGYIELGRLKPGDEVIVPANTYIASVLPLTEFGLIPIMAEPDPYTHNIDFDKVDTLLTERTKAIIPVHLYGSPAWDSEMMRSLKEKGILVVEDNAQAIGAEAATPGFRGSRTTGGLGDAAAISFYPTKNIGALGDAGAVLTSDSELADMVTVLANYGADRRYHNITTGYNCRMDEIQAAFLRVKLSYLDDIITARNLAARAYDAVIDNPAVLKPLILPDEKQVWHQYVVTVENRDKFRSFLADKGIGTDIHYAVPPHLQPCYKENLKVSLPVAEKLADRIVSIPIAGISPEDSRIIGRIINDYRP